LPYWPACPRAVIAEPAPDRQLGIRSAILTSHVPQLEATVGTVITSVGLNPRLSVGPGIWDLAALGVHISVAMKILRHSRIAVTAEIYTQVPDPATRDALRRLSDLLGGPQDGAEQSAGDVNDGQADDDSADPTQPTA
jgi:hypothetical protein